MNFSSHNKDPILSQAPPKREHFIPHITTFVEFSTSSWYSNSGGEKNSDTPRHQGDNDEFVVDSVILLKWRSRDCVFCFSRILNVLFIAIEKFGEIVDVVDGWKCIRGGVDKLVDFKSKCSDVFEY